MCIQWSLADGQKNIFHPISMTMIMVLTNYFLPIVGCNHIHYQIYLYFFQPENFYHGVLVIA